MENPRRNLADSCRHIGKAFGYVGWGPLRQFWMRFERGRWRGNPAADHHQSGKPARILLRPVPGAVTAQGKPRPVGSLPAAPEFLRRCIQGRHCQIVHRRLNPPEILPALRHHNDGRNAPAIVANFRGDAYVSLLQAVVTAFAGAVKEKNDWPFLMRRPVFRKKYLVLIS